MQTTERQQILLEIFEYAQNSKSMEFRILVNLADYFSCRRQVSQTELVLKVLRQGADTLFKKYCKAVITGNADFTRLLAYRHTMQTALFYEHELNTLCDMLEEFEEYLRAGNFLTALVGESRTGADAVDFRKYR